MTMYGRSGTSLGMHSWSLAAKSMILPILARYHRGPPWYEHFFAGRGLVYLTSSDSSPRTYLLAHCNTSNSSNIEWHIQKMMILSPCYEHKVIDPDCWKWDSQWHKIVRPRRVVSINVCDKPVYTCHAPEPTVGLGVGLTLNLHTWWGKVLAHILRAWKPVVTVEKGKKKLQVSASWATRPSKSTH